jgi:hypothetical protein
MPPERIKQKMTSVHPNIPNRMMQNALSRHLTSSRIVTSSWFSYLEQSVCGGELIKSVWLQSTATHAVSLISVKLMALCTLPKSQHGSLPHFPSSSHATFFTPPPPPNKQRRPTRPSSSIFNVGNNTVSINIDQ